MGRRRPQAARLGRAGRVRPRAEDRRARDQPDVRERGVRARRDARRRRGRRGRDGESAHDPVDPAAAARRRRAAARRGARRGLHAALRLPRAQRTARLGGEEADAEPAQRRGRVAPAEGPLDHRPATALRLGVRCRRPRRRRADDALADTRVAARARLPHEPVRRAPGRRRGGGRGVPRLGAPARRARLRDRRDRDQGRRPRPAARARRVALAPALGARVQVGADDGDHTAREDHDPRRAHGRAQSVGGARSRSRSAASRSRARRSTTRRTSTARTSARGTT